jgi:hypothetical protein
LRILSGKQEIRKGLLTGEEVKRVRTLACGRKQGPIIGMRKNGSSAISVYKGL